MSKASIFSIYIFMGGLLAFTPLIAFAELKARVKNNEYDAAVAYKKSFDAYDNVYVGSFDYNVVGQGKDKKVYVEGTFNVEFLLKGTHQHKKIKFNVLSYSRCIDKNDRKNTLSKIESMAKTMSTGRYEMESLIINMNLAKNKADCFFAVSSFQGNEEMPYKNKYELVFKQQQYVFFVNNKNLSKDGHINEFFVDLVLYDSVRALK